MYHMAPALLCDVGLFKGAAGQSRCSIMHCIASHRCLPPPLIPPFLHSVCSTLRSSAVVAGLELQVLVPSGPAPGRCCCCCYCLLLLRGPSPVSPAQPIHCPFSKIHARGQISSAYALASQMFYETRPGPPWLSIPCAEHSTARATAWQGQRCDTMISKVQQRCGRYLHTQKAEQSKSKSTGRRPSFFKDPPPLASSWETRKCDQGPRMCPITRGFPAISLSMIPSSGDRRSSLPVPSTPSQHQQGAWVAWGPRAAAVHQQIPTAACNERDKTADSKSPLPHSCHATLPFYDVGPHAAFTNLFLPFAAAVGPEKAGCYMRPMHV